MLVTRWFSSSSRWTVGSTPLRTHGRTALRTAGWPRSWRRTNNPDNVVADNGDKGLVLLWPSYCLLIRASALVFVWMTSVHAIHHSNQDDSGFHQLSTALWTNPPMVFLHMDGDPGLRTAMSHGSSTLQASRIPTGQLQHTALLQALETGSLAWCLSYLALLIKVVRARQRSKHCMVQTEMRFQPPARSYLTGVRGRDVGRRGGFENKERYGRRAHRTTTNRSKFFKTKASQDVTPRNLANAYLGFGTSRHFHLHGYDSWRCIQQTFPKCLSLSTSLFSITP